LREIGPQAFQNTPLQRMFLPSIEVIYQPDTFPVDCAVSVGVEPVSPVVRRSSSSNAPLVRPQSVQNRRIVVPAPLKVLPVRRAAKVERAHPISPRAVSPTPSMIQNRVLPECGVRLEECKELKELGNGSFGRTALLDRNGREYVAKFFTFIKGRISHDQQMNFAKTAESLQGLTHPRLLRFIGSSQIGDDSAMILMPFTPSGSLADLLNTNPKPPWWTPTAVVIIFIGIILGMEYAHSQEINHGSLKPRNILLDGEHNIMISDFGAAQWERAGVRREVQQDAVLYVDQGGYEDDEDQNGFAADVYSFGVILYEIMMTGRGPADVLRRIALNKILSGTRPELPRDFNQWVRDLVDDCWSPNPKQRPPFQKIMQIFEKEHFVIASGVNVSEVEAVITRTRSLLSKK
jgi:tRNA A-37 threonylcarbamoyl transferase component Bud32